jgi:hypothetical protein
MTGSICKCGLAKSYHGPKQPNLADHDYDPRYPDNELDDVIDLVSHDRFFIDGPDCEARAHREGDLIEWNTLEAAVAAVREEAER